MAVKTVSVSKPKTVSSYKAPKNTVKDYVAGTYKSAYGNQLNTALDNVVNFQYDPLQDASYKALANLYAEKGNRAARDTLGDAASLNGGYGTSYAVSAAQQARNQYNQELASMIPDMEDRAYNRATGTLNALRAADDTAYSRFRDTEADKKYTYEQAYQKYRDSVSDAQYAYDVKYQKYRDLMGDYQWGKGYNLDVANYNLSKKNSSRGGSGRSSGGGGGYSSGSGSNNNPYSSIYDNTKKKTTSLTTGMWQPDNTPTHTKGATPNRYVHGTTSSTAYAKATGTSIKKKK